MDLRLAEPPPSPGTEVPTLFAWGLLVLVTLLSGLTFLYVRIEVLRREIHG